MSLRAMVTGSVVALIAVACASQESPTVTDGTWVGTITTEGNVTTVVNESGSVWGGNATLVEEASIGVETGDDFYMLGRVRGLAASADRIYVIDSQVPALRVYDWHGNYLSDLGREGDGPGEFRNPSGVGVDATGNVWLHGQNSMRIVVFSSTGQAIATLGLGGARLSGSPLSMIVATDGRAYVIDIIRPDGSIAERTASRLVRTPYGIDGVAGAPIEIPRGESVAGLEARSANAVRFTEVPFHPNLVTAFAPSRAVLSGYPDAYRFEVRHSSGATTVIERAWEPIAVHADEAAAYQRAAVAHMRDMDPAWVWDGPSIPTTKPAFSRFVPSASGETWVVRPGAATFDADCDEESFEPSGDAHCWPGERIVDVFDFEGRYLGEIEVPAALSLQPPPFVRGNDVIARVEDETGTIMVKRYRLVLPGEEGQ